MAKLLHRCSLQLFADYHQFYVWDPAGASERLAPIAWDNSDIQRRIKAAPATVVVCPIRDTTIPVEIEIYDAEPNCIFAQWHHVAEASLQVSSGSIEVHECTGGSLALFTVQSGWYRVRALFAGLNTLDAAGLEGKDQYRITIWPAPFSELRVIKEWNEQ